MKSNKQNEFTLVTNVNTQCVKRVSISNFAPLVYFTDYLIC
jgi:hypothetical protein